MEVCVYVCISAHVYVCVCVNALIHNFNQIVIDFLQMRTRVDQNNEFLNKAFQYIPSFLSKKKQFFLLYSYFFLPLFLLTSLSLSFDFSFSFFLSCLFTHWHPCTAQNICILLPYICILWSINLFYSVVFALHK